MIDAAESLKKGADKKIAASGFAFQKKEIQTSHKFVIGQRRRRLPSKLQSLGGSAIIAVGKTR
jgi:hypothetical protein